MGSSREVDRPNPFVHGSKLHEAVVVDSYNVELRDGDGFLGDRASKGAFFSLLERRREQTRQVTEDPLGDIATEDLKKKTMEKVLTDGDLDAAGLIHGAVEEFANELASVASRFLKLKSWSGTERIVVGGGFRSGRVGEMVIRRASILLQTEHGYAIEFVPLRHHPDEAGLLGNLHVVPSWTLSGYDSMLTVDIGGTNIRVGVVELNQDKDASFKSPCVGSTELWRHADEEASDRDDCVERLAKMLRDQIKEADKRGLTLAPLIGIGCPGRITEDGSIEKGAQNLPGNWQSSRFNLAESIRSSIPKIGENETIVVVHNDAVVQGLSETPWMQDVTHWGVLTIGTGLGNARFSNRVVKKRSRKSAPAPGGREVAVR